MKHLHLQFIAAGCALGLGLFMLILTGWQAQAMTAPSAQSWQTISPMIDLFVGSVLLSFGWHGVRSEIVHARR